MLPCLMVLVYWVPCWVSLLEAYLRSRQTSSTGSVIIALTFTFTTTPHPPPLPQLPASHPFYHSLSSTAAYPHTYSRKEAMKCDAKWSTVASNLLNSCLLLQASCSYWSAGVIGAGNPREVISAGVSALRYKMWAVKLCIMYYDPL